MPRAHDPRNIGTDRLPANVIGGPIPDQGWANARDVIDDPVGFFINQLLQQIKDTTGIDLFWMLDWSWTTNTILDLARQANDLVAWLQNPIQRPPNLLSRPGFSSPSAIAAAPDWFWDAVVSVGTVAGPDGRPRTDPQGSARTTADGVRHALLSNPISGAAVAAGQILTCQMRALVEDGFTASDDQAICLELVPSRAGVLGDPVVLAHCGVPTDDPTDWIAAPVGSKAVFFDVDYRVPTEDVPDTIELRPVVNESAGGGVPVRFDGARVAAAGGFLVVLADLFDAGREYLTDLWTAITDWLADMSQWSAFVSASDAAWVVFVKRVKRALRHADADSYVPPSTSGIISDALKNNEWFGWLFTMVDDWLQPVLTIGKAATDFGDALWQAVTVFAAAPGAAGAWSTLTAAITAAWNTLVDTVLAAWGSSKTHADFASPGTATEAALKNNPVIGWVFDLDGLLDAFVDVTKAGWDAIFGTTYYTGSFTDAWNALMDKLGWSSAPTKTIGQVGSAVGSNLLSTWVHSITDPIDDFFDSVRKYINQMIEGLHWGYFDTNWVWVPSLTTPNADKPTGDPVMTPGRNDDTTPAISSGADATIPGKPTGLVAIPWLDLTVSGFPAGKITYAIAAVKNGIEGPAAMVSAFAGTLVPPNTFGRVDLAYSAPAGGADSYRVYREVDATYEAQSWRLVATPTSDYPVLTPPLSDKTVRTSGVTAHPKTDAELAAQIVTSVKSTADGAAVTAGTANATAGSAQAAATDAQSTAIDANNAAVLAAAKFEALPEANIVINNFDHESEDWGVTVATSVVGATWVAPDGGGSVVPTPVSWTQPIPAGSKAVVVMIAYAREFAGPYPPSLSFSDAHFADHPVNAGLANDTVATAGTRIVWVLPISSSFEASSVTITATWDSDARITLVDAASLVVDGSASGDFSVIQVPSGSQDFPADSLAIQMSSRFTSSASTNPFNAWSGFVSERTVANLASQQTDRTYGLGTRIASLDVDAATSVSILGTGSTLIVMKSADRPAEDQVGSYARMVTNSTVAAPANVLNGNIMPLSNYYQAEIHSPDITVDLATASFQIFYTGTYLVDFTVACDASSAYLPAVLVNGIAVSYGGNGAPNATGVTYPTGLPVMAHAGLVYLNKGDYVSFGVWANSGTPTLSRAATIPKHAAISLVNRSYL